MLIPKELARYVGLGAEIAASLLLPVFLGHTADNYWDIAPAGILTGAFVGLVLFFMLILRLYRSSKSK